MLSLHDGVNQGLVCCWCKLPRQATLYGIAAWLLGAAQVRLWHIDATLGAVFIVLSC
jgi:hypothetical protein